MSGQTPFDPAKAQLEAFYAMQQPPTAEPIMAQSDDTIRQLIIDRTVEYEWVKLPNDKVGRQVKAVKHPDVQSWIMTLSPLDSTSYFDRDQSTIMWFLAKQDLRKQHAKNRNNGEIQDLLSKIKSVKYRQIFGDSEMGRKQNYIAKLGGSERRIELTRGDKKPWWKGV